MMRIRFAALGLIGAILVSAVSGWADESAPRRLSFIPLWVPQAQFAGFYVAYERGFYAAHGIDLTILTGGPDHPASEMLASGKADVGVLWLSTAIRLRADHAPIVQAAQLVQRSSLMLVAMRASGIHSPRDLDGRKVGVWQGDFLLQPRAFFKEYGLNVRTVPQGSSINLFLRGGVDAAAAMWYNEYHTILDAGVDPDELTTFFFYEHGLNFPEDGIYCREPLANDPVCAAFAQASLEGWRYAFGHPDEALDVVMKYIAAAHLPANRTHQRWMLARMHDVIAPPDDPVPLGTLRREDFDRVARVLMESETISAVPDFAAFHVALPAAQ
jgi:NitT/TauT family transport system substrate-binding protein